MSLTNYLSKKTTFWITKSTRLIFLVLKFRFWLKILFFRFLFNFINKIKKWCFKNLLCFFIVQSLYNRKKCVYQSILPSQEHCLEFHNPIRIKKSKDQNFFFCFCHKLKSSDPIIFVNLWYLIIKKITIWNIQGLGLWGYKDIEIRKSEFVIKNSFLILVCSFTVFFLFRLFFCFF